LGAAQTRRKGKPLMPIPFPALKSLVTKLTP
jgi:hypothetical protein